MTCIAPISAVCLSMQNLQRFSWSGVTQLSIQNASLPGKVIFVLQSQQSMQSLHMLVFFAHALHMVPQSIALDLLELIPILHWTCTGPRDQDDAYELRSMLCSVICTCACGAKCTPRCKAFLAWQGSYLSWGQLSLVHQNT